MATTAVTSRSTKPAGRTQRTDGWWRYPLVTALVFGGFVIYATWAILINKNFYTAPYISPFYSPCIVWNCGQAANATIIGHWWPAALTPALIVAIFPLGFRVTCYYYRKAYYRSFWLSPPACAVAEPHRSYSGETRFPLILQNVHRYFWYFALLVAGVLTADTVESFHFPNGWGMGLGSLIFTVNIVLIWLYTLSCHSCRHIMGGRLNHFSRHPLRYWFWTQVSKINTRHAVFAWASLVSVALCDLYVRLVASGTITDPRFF